MLWSTAVKLLEAGEHLKSAQNCHYVMSIYAALGRGASSAVKQAFPALSPVTLPAYTVPVTVDTLSPWWLSGYLTLYCSFSLTIEAAGWKQDFYQKYRHRFAVSFASLPNYELFASVIAQYLGLPYYIRMDGRIDVVAQSESEAHDLILFLDNYPLQSYKDEHYNIWREAALQLASDRSNRQRTGTRHVRFYALTDKLNELKQQDSKDKTTNGVANI